MTPAPVETLPIDRIYANPDLPTKVFERAALEALAGEIRREGPRPITVVKRPHAAGEYCIVLGERIWRASQLAQRLDIPAVVREPRPALLSAPQTAAAVPAPPTRAGLVRLPLARICPNPDQPRKFFDAAALADLAASIRVNGLLQPITVTPKNGSYQIVMGERRWHASQLAGLSEIEAIVRTDLDAAGVAERALVENLLRADLGLVEEARAYRAFLARGYTAKRLADTLGFHNSTRIQLRLQLLQLAPELLAGVEKGAIAPGQAQEMSRLSIEGQFVLWRAIQEGQCGSPAALKRMAAAIHDRENQVELFRATITAREKEALSQIDRFVLLAGRLLSVVTPEDIRTLHDVPKANARASADHLELIEKLCRELRHVLLANAAKQELLQ